MACKMASGVLLVALLLLLGETQLLNSVAAKPVTNAPSTNKGKHSKGKDDPNQVKHRVSGNEEYVDDWKDQVGWHHLAA